MSVPTREQQLADVTRGFLRATDKLSDAIRLSDHAPAAGYLHLVEDLRLTVPDLQQIKAIRCRALAVLGAI